MGFFDFLNSDDPMKQQSLLSAAAAMLQASGPSRTPVSFGQVLGQGVGTYQQSLRDLQDHARQQQTALLQSQLLGLKLKDAQSDLDNQELQRKHAQDFNEFTTNYWKNNGGQPPVDPSFSPRGRLAADVFNDVISGKDPAAAQQTPAPSPQVLPATDRNSIAQQRLLYAQAARKAGYAKEADAAEESAMKLQPEWNTTPQVVRGADGNPMLIQLAKDGSARPLNGYGVADKLDFRDGGGSIVGLDNYTGKVVSTLRKTQSPDSIAVDRRAAADRAAGPDMDPHQVENVAQMIAAGRMAPLGSMAMRSPFGAAVMSRVAEINPQFDGTSYGTTSKAARDFATGKQGNAVRSFNVSLSHLDTLGQLADAMGNGNTQLINKWGNAYASQTGSAAPTNFEAAKKIVTDEIVKAITGGGGGVADREAAAHTIAAANSPAQLKGVIKTYQELMVGQLGGLEQQYRTTTGRDDFNKYLSPQAQAMYHPAAQSPAAATPAASARPGAPKVIRFEDLP